MRSKEGRPARGPGPGTSAISRADTEGNLFREKMKLYSERQAHKPQETRFVTTTTATVCRKEISYNLRKLHQFKKTLIHKSAIFIDIGRKLFHCVHEVGKGERKSVVLRILEGNHSSNGKFSPTAILHIIGFRAKDSM